MSDNPYGYTPGNCTWWVDHLAPWIDQYGNFGDAHNWISHARSQSLQISSQPQPGEIAVWDASSPGSGGYGHVALVTGVQQNGLPIVSEMNYKGLGITDTRNVDASNAHYLIGYIVPPSQAMSTSSIAAAGSAPQNATLADLSGTTSSGWSVGPFQVLSGSGVHKFLFTLSGVALLGIGVWILFRKEADRALAAIPAIPK